MCDLRFLNMLQIRLHTNITQEHEIWWTFEITNNPRLRLQTTCRVTKLVNLLNPDQSLVGIFFALNPNRQHLDSRFHLPDGI